MKLLDCALSFSTVMALSIATNAATSDYSEFFGSGIAGEAYSKPAIKFTKNATRLCKGKGGFFSLFCDSKDIGKKADALNTQVGDYCDAMVTGDQVIYRLPDFYNTDEGANYLSVANETNCKILTKQSSNQEPKKRSSVLTDADLKSVAVHGQSEQDQPAQIVIRQGDKVNWLMVYQTETGVPKVQLRDSKNVKLTIDEYFLAKANGNLYAGIVGFRTMSCEKMAAENHDIYNQVSAKQFDETCLELVGQNRSGDFVNAGIIPSSSLKKHLFKNIEEDSETYSVDDDYTAVEVLIDLLSSIFE